MKFIETKISGAFIIEPTKITDERGFFARTWSKKQFDAHGVISCFVEFNTSFSKTSGTIRGLHYQVPPFREAKLVRCTKGAIYDVIIDLRPESLSYKRWLGVELRADTYKMLYVPEGVGHGFQTLEDDAEVFYPVSQFYSPEFERGVRWDDPMFAIEWPETERVIISDKDRSWRDYRVEG